MSSIDQTTDNSLSQKKISPEDSLSENSTEIPQRLKLSDRIKRAFSKETDPLSRDSHQLTQNNKPSGLKLTQPALEKNVIVKRLLAQYPDHPQADSTAPNKSLVDSPPEPNTPKISNWRLEGEFSSATSRRIRQEYLEIDIARRKGKFG